MYVGVRAGGGIGDQIEDPAGDEYEIYRMIFDITFFFFVIVILLAIIQGESSILIYPHPCMHYFEKKRLFLCSNLLALMQGGKSPTLEGHSQVGFSVLPDRKRFIECGMPGPTEKKPFSTWLYRKPGSSAALKEWIWAPLP